MCVDVFCSLFLFFTTSSIPIPFCISLLLLVVFQCDKNLFLYFFYMFALMYMFLYIFVFVWVRMSVTSIYIQPIYILDSFFSTILNTYYSDEFCLIIACNLTTSIKEVMSYPVSEHIFYLKYQNRSFFMSYLFRKALIQRHSLIDMKCESPLHFA